MTEQERLLFEAFKAGFAASTETFNGEYVHPDYYELDEALMEEFTDWQRQMTAKALS